MASLVGVFTGLLAGMSCATADPLNAHAEIHLVPEYHEAETASPFHLPRDVSVFPARTGRLELELNLNWQGVQAVATLAQQGADGAPPETSAVLNELYWDGELLGQDLSLGKKIRSAGVGFGYRPLDVIQRENRRRLYPDTLEGVSAMAWQYFGIEDAWSLIYANPGQGKHDSKARDDESLTATYYGLQGDTDVHALVRLSERQRLELGGGFTRVFSDHLEVHGSLLYQDRGERLVNSLVGTRELLSFTDAMDRQSLDPLFKGLLGLTWTGDNGWSVLAEAWYDGEAYSVEDWQGLAALTRRQLELQGLPVQLEPAIYANIAASSQVFEPINLLRWNTLLRISHDGSRLDPFLEILFTPEDSGYVATLGADYSMESHMLGLRLRVFGGPDNAAYQLLPENWVVLAFWEWNLF